MQIEWNYNGITNVEEVKLDSNHERIFGGKHIVSNQFMENGETTRPQVLKTNDIHKRRVYYDGASL